MFADSLAAARESLFAAAGQTITYRRGEDTVQLTAVPAQAKYEELDDVGHVQERVTSQDWLIRPTELTLGGDAIEPLAGDVIESNGATYSVCRPAPRVPCWSWSDSSHAWRRVHSTAT